MERALSHMTQKTWTCDQYLDKMTEILASLTGGREVAEDEKVHLRATFKQLLGFLVRQKQADISAGVTADNTLQNELRENDRLSRQKHVQLGQHVAKISHLKKQITKTGSIVDRALYTHTLAFLEDIAADDEFKWELHIMSHWYNAVTRSRKVGNACQHLSGADDNKDDRPRSTEATDSLGEHHDRPRSSAVATSAYIPKQGDWSPSNIVSVPPGGHHDSHERSRSTEVSNDVPREHSRKSDDVGANQESQQSLVSELDSFVTEISVHLSDRLEEFQQQMAVLRQKHRASYKVEMDNTLAAVAAVADVASVADVACIKEDISHVELVGNRTFISTIVDKTQEKYERASHLPQKHAWAILLERVKALRDAYSVGIDLLQRQTVDLASALDQDIDTVMVRTAQLDTTVHSIEGDGISLRVRRALDDLVSRISPQ